MLVPPWAYASAVTWWVRGSRTGRGCPGWQDLDWAPYRVWALVRDSQMAGKGASSGRAPPHSLYTTSSASTYRDLRDRRPRGPTESADLEAYAQRAEAFGARGVLTIDGHDLAEIDLRPATAGGTSVTKPDRGAGPHHRSGTRSSKSDNHAGTAGPFRYMAKTRHCRLARERHLTIRGRGPARLRSPPAAAAYGRRAAGPTATIYRRPGRDAQGVRRRPRRPRRRAPPGRGPGRRNEQLHRRGRVCKGVSGTLLRDVHRRAAARRRGRRAPASGTTSPSPPPSPTRSSLPVYPTSSRMAADPQGERPALGLPLGCGDLLTAVPTHGGAGRPGHDARGATATP